MMCYKILITGSSMTMALTLPEILSTEFMCTRPLHINICDQDRQKHASRCSIADPAPICFRFGLLTLQDVRLVWYEAFVQVIH